MLPAETFPMASDWISREPVRVKQQVLFSQTAPELNLLEPRHVPSTGRFTLNRRTYDGYLHQKSHDVARSTTNRRHKAPSAVTTGRNNQTHTEAPLDCSIESHPDCPRPSGGNQVMIFRSIRSY